MKARKQCWSVAGTSRPTPRQVSPNDRPGDKRLGIALAMLICLVFVSLGVVSIVTGVSATSTKRYGHVVLFDTVAQWMGAVEISVGMMVLAIAMPSKRLAQRWLLGWLGVAFGCFAAALVQANS